MVHKVHYGRKSGTLRSADGERRGGMAGTRAFRMDKPSDRYQLSSFAHLLRQGCLGQAALTPDPAQQVPCSLDTVKKLETDARRPSRRMAARLADLLQLGGAERVEFLAAARNSGMSGTNPGMARASAAQDVLPLQFTSFIGREHELNTLAALLADPACRLVTLTGPGGIGKTRIALELATRLLASAAPHPASFSDGVWFVAL